MRHLLIACALLAGCDLSQMSRRWDRYPSQIETLAARRAPATPLGQSQRRGQGVYEHYCQICHGHQGRGDGFNSSTLTSPPRNFTDDAFWSQTTDEELTSTIADGGKSVGKSNLMPAWGLTLDRQQIRDVTAYLRKLSESASASITPPTAP